ncbi:MAG TPA: hypothetical protein VIN63_08320 [Candidatus Limnocylindria bacterium]
MRYVRILALVALCLAYSPTPALAVTGYDSAYSGESAFVNINPGETASFQVFFSNTGTLTWTKGGDTQVDLAACLADKVTCPAQDPTDSTWNSGWLSATRYATATQATVAPGTIATFGYNIKAPSNATAGTNRFNGDLVVSSSGARIHPEGYYQDATVQAIGNIPVPTPTPTPGSTPFPSAPPAPIPTPTPNVLRADAGVFCDGVSSGAGSCTTPANPQGPYGPALASTATAEWVSQDSNSVLHLAKECTGVSPEGINETCLAANSSAGAEITVNGAHFTAPITELGFDVAPDAYCGAGAPRFNVYTAADFSTALFFGCAGGTHTSLPGGWTRVRFGPVVGSVFALEVIQDEPGSTFLDNIDVNGILITNSAGTTLP